MIEINEVPNKAEPIHSATADSLCQTNSPTTNVSENIVEGGIVNPDVDIDRGAAERKQLLVLFDRNSKSLHTFDHRRREVEKMHCYPDAIARLAFTAVSFGEYIYVFMSNRSAYRLRFIENRKEEEPPEWERIRDWIEDHGDREPSVVCSSNAILIVGGWLPRESRASSAVSRYDISSDRWNILGDKPTATSSSALACTEEFLYCIGGMNSDYNPTSVVERMNLKTKQWTGIEEMKHGRFLASAAEVGDKIFVVDRNRKKLEIEMYDSKAGKWEERKSLDIAGTGTAINKCFVIASNLFVVCSDRIVTYNVEKDTNGPVTIPKDNQGFQEAVLMMESSKTFPVQAQDSGKYVAS